MWTMCAQAPFAFGLETRVPFLDKDFLQLCMNIDPADKMVSRSRADLLDKLQSVS